MRLVERIRKEINKTENFLIIVEGKRDEFALQHLGFKKIFVINETGKSLKEKIEQIIKIAEENKKIKICILTDFDKEGKKLYLMLKKELAIRGAKLDNSLRYLLLKSKISHIEGLDSFLIKQENLRQKK